MSDIVSLRSLLFEAAKFDNGKQGLGALRNQARAEFVAHGLPTRRLETWKYSDLSQALNETTRPAEAPRDALAIPGAALARFENGVLDANSGFHQIGALSLMPVLAGAAPGLAAQIGTVNPLKDHPIVNLNTAVMSDGLVLHVGKGISGPLHVNFRWRPEDGSRVPEGGHLRLFVELERGAEFTLIETHDGAPSFATIVSEFRLADGVRLNHLRIDRLGQAARQSAVTLAEVGTGASYRAFYLSEGGHFARHEAQLKLVGEEAQANIDGAYLVGNGRHCDNTTVMAHAAPSTSSRQSFRGVLAGRSRGVFQGCVRVAQVAQRTDAYQMSRALLLSREAEIATKPELEIFADDVKCSHGATAGELDPAALFFLRARGIPESEARALLVRAFLFEAFDAIENTDLRDLVSGCADTWLEQHANEVNHVG
jgi:Fe-S cluster assembly protein SufD